MDESQDRPRGGDPLMTLLVASGIPQAALGAVFQAISRKTQTAIVARTPEMFSREK